MIYFINIDQSQGKKKELGIVLVGFNKSVIHLKIKVMILIVLKELFMEEKFCNKTNSELGSTFTNADII